MKVYVPEIYPEEVEIDYTNPNSKLGKGSFGVVYKGRCRGMDVAVKILRKKKIEKLKMFQAEVKKMSTFNHPNICMFLGACTIGDFFIVTQYHPKGDVEKALHSNAEISIFRRMKWAKDAALGMNWLHENNPVVVHRDLKSSNLLIDENENVLVCDFGLSEAKGHGEMLKDKRSAKGTPLWMAPEVMNFLEFNEKADVYSYGIILWELLTRLEPWESYDFEELKELRDAVSNNMRPVIPENSNQFLLIRLMRMCWDGTPEYRPSFDVILENFSDKLIIEASIDDLEGRRFWTENFWKHDNENGILFVHFGDFIRKFLLFFDVPSRENLDDEETSKTKQISVGIQLLLGIKNHLDFVDIEAFGAFCHQFGPLDPSVDWRESVLEDIRLLISNPWFHGNIERKTAHNLLLKSPEGSFLIRYSSEPGSFALTIRQKKTITNKKISLSPDQGFIINNNEYPSLQMLVEGEGYDLDLACPGSQFLEAFSEVLQIEGYT